MDRPFSHEDNWWFFFGYGDGWPGDKCSACIAAVEVEKKANRHCINCWKLELFFSNCRDLPRVKEILMAEARRDRSIHGKWLREPVRLSPELRAKITSIPETGWPGPAEPEEGVILIYTQSIAERDEKSKRIRYLLDQDDLYARPDISARRGCLNFDEVIGPWKNWWPLDRDFAKE
ncbi:MAG: hypothetical protein ACE5E0_06695 [Terriglobia bacterium]